MLKISPELGLPLDAATGTFGVLATKGAGKSNAAVVMAEEMYDAGVPWVAVDPKGDWWGIRADGDGKGAGLPIVVFGGRHGDVPLEPTAGALIADLVLEQRLTCVLDVSQFTKGDTTRFLLAFGQRLFAHADDDGAEPLHLFLEEAHEYLPQSFSTKTDGGEIAKLVNTWQRIVKQGRFKGLGCTLISQRSSVLNKDVLELIDTLIVLRTIGPLSRNSIAAWVADQDVDKGLLASLPSLADGEAWVWSPGALKILEKIRFRRRRTFDSGATPKVGQTRRQPATLADVDLAAIKDQMAETIERAKADDPKELRREIAALRKELATRPTEKVVETVEVPVIDTQLLRQVLNALTQVELGLVDVSGLMKTIEGALTDGVRVAPRVDPIQINQRRDPTPRNQPAPRRDIGTKTFSGDVTQLPKGERLILTAVAQYADGVTREQLTVLTGYKRSTRDAYVLRLDQRECVFISSGIIRATDVGFEALGPDFEPLPTGAALRAHYDATLPHGERLILAELCDAYPSGLGRDELSDRTGFKRSTRDAYLQRLRARQLVTTDGEPRAADVLFEERR